MTGSEQLCLPPEGAHQRGAALHGTQVVSSAVRQVAKIASAEVRHGVMFEVSPDALHGIELRCIRRQELKSYGAALSLNMRAHEFGAMCLQTIPDDQQLLADRGLKGLEELDHLRRAGSTLHVAVDTRAASGEALGLHSFVGTATAPEATLVRIRTRMRGMPGPP